MTALDVFAVAVGLTIDARAREAKDHLPHRTLALDGLAGIVAAYITLHRHAKVNLPSGHLLTDALLRPDAASVELCCDRREGKPPVVDEMVKKGPAHQLPRYGLEARPPGEREQLVPFTFRLLTADHLARFTLTHTLVDVQLQAADFPAHLLHTTPEFRNAMRRARMPRHTYTAVHPTTIAFWAVEVLCYLEKVLEASFGACYVLRVINIFERESRASGYKDVWIAEEMWSLCLKAVERNGELEVLRDGVHKLKDEDFICTLAEWEIGMHGGDRTALEASYRQTFSMFAEIITDSVAASLRRTAEHAVPLRSHTVAASSPGDASQPLPRREGNQPVHNETRYVPAARTDGLRRAVGRLVPRVFKKRGGGPGV